MRSPQRLAKAIEDLCAEKGVSVNKVLTESGAGERLCQNLKRGSYPSVDRINKVAEYLDCTIDYLIGRTDNPKIYR